jgi:hypothetical protein
MSANPAYWDCLMYSVSVKWLKFCASASDPVRGLAPLSDDRTASPAVSFAAKIETASSPLVR